MPRRSKDATAHRRAILNVSDPSTVLVSEQDVACDRMLSLRGYFYLLVEKGAQDGLAEVQPEQRLEEPALLSEAAHRQTQTPRLS
jgi:hypothetical protein